MGKRIANIVIRVTPKERKQLEILAAKEGLSLSAWVRRFAYIPAKGYHWIPAWREEKSP